MPLKPTAAIYKEASGGQASEWKPLFLESWLACWRSGVILTSSACNRQAVALNIEESYTDVINIEKMQAQRWATMMNKKASCSG